jgi:hypothetical protein
MNKIIIKKNIIAIVVPILLLIPVIFTLPFVIGAAIIYMHGLERVFVFLAIVPVLLGLGILGLMNLISVIRFGRKKILIDEEGIISFWVIRREYLWADVLNISKSRIGDQEFLKIETRNTRKEFTILLGDSELTYGNDEIYEMVLNYWVKVNV